MADIKRKHRTKPKGEQKKRGRHAKAKPEDVIAALQAAYGIQAVAARQLGIGRSTIAGYIADDPVIKAAYDSINEETIDRVENKLLSQIDAGNITAIIFYLKTKAKHRGYVEVSLHGMKEINSKQSWRELMESTIIEDEKNTDAGPG